MDYINIETRNSHFEKFKVIPIKCKIGDTIYFDDDGSYLEGIIESIELDKWWIYDDGTKAYGRVIVRCATKESHYYNHNFSVDAGDIIYNKPKDYERYWGNGCTTIDVYTLALKEYAPWAIGLDKDEYILDEHIKLQIEAFITGYNSHD